MWIYLVSFACISAVYLLSISIEAVRLKAWLCWLLFVFFVLFVGLRYEIGNDWSSYESLFYSFRYEVTISSFIYPEPAYGLLNLLVARAGLNFFVLNLVCITMALLVLMKSFDLFRMERSLGFVLCAPYLIFVVGMDYARQFIAICLAICSVGFIADGKSGKAYVLSVFACLFHYSAILSLFLLVYQRVKLRYFIFWGALALPILYSAIISTYLESYGTGSSWTSKGVWMRLGLLLVGATLFWFQREMWKSRVALYLILKSATILLLILFPLALVMSTMVDRMSLYLFPLFILPVASLANSGETQSGRWAIVFAIIIFQFASLAGWLYVTSYQEYWIPYKSVFGLNSDHTFSLHF